MKRSKKRLLERQASQCDTSRPFLDALAQSQTHNSQVRRFLEMSDRYARAHLLMPPVEFNPDHPVEEVGRLFMAVLLKHHDLGHVVASLLEHGPPEVARGSQKHGFPRSLASVLKFVGALKLSLMRVRITTLSGRLLQ